MKRFLILILFIGIIFSQVEDDEIIGVDISYIDSALIDIVWCGVDKDSDDNILVLSSKGSVYRSSDKGEKWTKMAEVFHRKALLSQEEQNEKIGVVNKILRSPVDPQLVIFLGTQEVNWISPDCGATVNAVGTGRQMREFQFHPKNKNYILASSWTKCPALETKECFVTKQLMLTQDMGLNWEPIASYLNQFQWGVKHAKDSTDIPENRILISYEPTGTGHQRLSGWSMKTHLYISDDFMKTTQMIVNSGNKFLLSQNFIFVAQVMNVQTQEVTLLVANSSETSYDFRYAQLPETLKDHSYTILDTSEGSIFININHLKPSSPIGTIYISDSTGTRFQLSLGNNVRTEEGQCDFEKVLGLEGIYIANVYNQEQAQLYITQYEDEDVIQTSKDKGQSQKVVKESDLSRFKQSRITFDKGATWDQIDVKIYVLNYNDKPPEKDSEGKRINCDPKSCSLNLHSVSTKLQFGPFYSTVNSIGVVVGTGNVGKYLSYRPDQINTYLSRDGGLSWHEISKGSHIYEISDHGGIIVLADDQQATMHLKYSWNEGLDWEIFKFSQTPVEIANIITEPSNTALKFIIYGTTEVQSNGQSIEQGIIITIDFSQLHTRVCEGADIPNKIGSDYETWTPNGKVNPECLMGKKTTYVRRKRDAQCFNKEDMEKIIIIESCNCLETDWECDLGFSRETIGQPCTANALIEIDYSPPERCVDSYAVTQGYRKVAGNQCSGGVDHSPVLLPCPGFKFFKIKNLWDILLIIIFGAIIYFLYQNRDIFNKQQQKTPLPTREMALQAMRAISKDGSQKQQGLGFREFDEDLLEN